MALLNKLLLNYTHENRHPNSKYYIRGRKTGYIYAEV